MLSKGLVYAPADHRLFYPAWKNIRADSEKALLKGEVTPELWKQLHDPATKRMHLMEMVGVMFVLYLMVLKSF